MRLAPDELCLDDPSTYLATVVSIPRNLHNTFAVLSIHVENLLARKFCAPSLDELDGPIPPSLLRDAKLRHVLKAVFFLPRRVNAPHPMLMSSNPFISTDNPRQTHAPPRSISPECVRPRTPSRDRKYGPMPWRDIERSTSLHRRRFQTRR